MNCSVSDKAVLNLTVIFLALVIIFLAMFLFFSEGKVFLNINAKVLIMVFVGIIISVVLLGVIADSVVSFCGSP